MLTPSSDRAPRTRPGRSTRGVAGPAGTAGRPLLALVLSAAALLGAFVLAPSRLAAGDADGDLVTNQRRVTAMRGGFVEYWHSGDRRLSPHLSRVVDYWYRFHLVKGLVSALLLTVLIMLTIALWKRSLNTRGAPRRAGLVSAGVLSTTLALVALAATMANIQGAAAPFSSLLPMLPAGRTDPALAGALDQAAHQLADARAGAPTTPPLDVMTADFALYHVVMAVVAAVVAVALLAVSVLLWRRNPADQAAKRVTRAYAALAAVLIVASLVLVAANVSVAAHPGPALLRALQGGL
ncbi:hypothetical protein MXD61_19225 [Frankia sp. AgPm24]|uniref:hypothetical protein n=1 Tax=Frankia sp. AgPm24 TaxID=631128 RepID=UPI00200F094B|nr:hypothetical protein [Frankia sp. AgPm24]MCK9923970.1 hypothetical protein [Frankia sp. AgPm24]